MLAPANIDRNSRSVATYIVVVRNLDVTETERSDLA